MSEIYALTDDFYTPPATIKDQLKEILDSGVKMVQFRSKAPKIDRDLVASLAEISKGYLTKFIINDDPILAKEVGASGVHIGKDDGDVKRAREILGSEAVVGASCYNSYNLALEASENLASYAAFGAVFSSTTKPNTTKFDIKNLANFKLNIKTCVIGGINARNLREILPFKPDYIAFVSAIYTPNSITQNIKNLQNNTFKKITYIYDFYFYLVILLLQDLLYFFFLLL